jgi:hypothetical protein
MKNNTIKIVSIVMVMFFCFSTGTMGKITRDINHDGIVNVSDLQSLLDIYVNKSADVESIDFNKDQKFDLKDALNLHRYFFEPSNQNTTPLNRTRSLKSDRFESPYLEVTNNSGNMNETISAKILLQGNYDHTLTECTFVHFSIRYHHDIILDAIDSDYFEYIISDMATGENVNELSCKTFVEAYHCSITDMSTLADNVLFNIKFRLRDSAAPGTYLIKIAPSQYIDVTDIFIGLDHYELNGEPHETFQQLIDSAPEELHGLINSEPDIYGNCENARHGSVTFIENTYDHIPTNDIDNDGIMDVWEFEHFKNLLIAGSDSDNDNDGYSDRLEQLNQTDPKNMDNIYANDQTIEINLKPIAEEPIITAKSESMSITISGDDNDGYYLRYIITSLPESGKLYGKAPFLIYKPDKSIKETPYFTFKVFDGFELSQPKKVAIKSEDSSLDFNLSLKDILFCLRILSEINTVNSLPENMLIFLINPETLDLIDIMFLLQILAGF